ncbi:MAG: hypothetical protein RBJ76_11540 [Stenomitos frigidus ULC029]
MPCRYQMFAAETMRGSKPIAPVVTMLSLCIFCLKRKSRSEEFHKIV